MTKSASLKKLLNFKNKLKSVKVMNSWSGVYTFLFLGLTTPRFRAVLSGTVKERVS